MAFFGLSVRRVSTLVAVLVCTANAQDQELNEPHKKWLDCDVSWLISEAMVGPSFSLKISFRSLPVSGPRISLSKDGRVVATARTNRNGVARFNRIPAGLSCGTLRGPLS